MQYPKLICLLAVVGLLAGCMSSRVAAHEETWQKIPPQDQERLRQGTLRVGDTEEMVRIALGAPDRVLQITRPEGSQTVWLYELSKMEEMGGNAGSFDPNSQPAFSTGYRKVPAGERQITFREGLMVNETKPAPARMGFGGLGQGGMNPENQLNSLDEAVRLTPEQRGKAREILEKEAAALNAIPQAERLERGMPFRQAARDDLRELLTPEQRRMQDDLRRAAQVQENEERTLVADFVRASKNIAARLGPVASLSYLSSSISLTDDARRGHFTYTVVGEKNSETLKIYWEKHPASAPIKIVRIEAGDGTAIPL